MASSRVKPKTHDSSGSWKTIFFLFAVAIAAGYFYSNFYVFYSQRLPGKLEISLKEKSEWNYCLINLDQIFPDSKDEMQSLLLGVETLEKTPDLRKILDKYQVINKIFSKKSVALGNS
ncbi:MAG: hypothetical protein PHW04_06180 [Candidatus Wallbacteria bacterium]|nr:hypothetical protein [Candidatus Wallbacteria bacterium]